MNARQIATCTFRLLIAVATVGTMLGPSALAQTTDPSPTAVACNSLASINLPNVHVTSSAIVAAGKFVPPNQTEVTTEPYAQLPTFCRVAAILTPVPDSEIRIEVWMPALGWNGKFQAVGNMGWGGVLSYKDMASALTSGYATASTNTGHTGNSAAFGIGHPVQLIDYSYRAVHEMAAQAKAIIKSFYGHASSLTFFNGCSYGGHQALVEAERYPYDFDGIVAGDPSLNWQKLNVARIATYAFVHRTDDSYIPPAKFPVIHDAALKACDAFDGKKDGIIDDPTKCHFDPGVLECKASDSTDCLTTAQIETAKTLYRPVIDPQTGTQIEPPMLLPGSELGWSVMAGPSLMSTPLTAFLKNGDASWDWHTFQPATDITKLLKIDTGLADLDDANLRLLKPFFDRGGKLLMYHGWADSSVPSLGSVGFVNNAAKQLGEDVVGKSIQLYMVSGMGHCGGGLGTDTFDKMAAIEEWEAKGTAPEQIPAAHLTGGKVDRTGVLCPYKTDSSTKRGMTSKSPECSRTN